MADLDLIVYSMSNKYTDDEVAGGGAIRGKNCVIDSITDIEGGHKVTFKWTLDNGTVQTGYMNVMNGAKGEEGQEGKQGRGIKRSYVNEENHFIVVYDDDTEDDL